jgi:hypothetical protein
MFIFAIAIAKINKMKNNFTLPLGRAKKNSHFAINSL